MENQPFRRLDSNEDVYQSPQEVGHASDPFRDPEPGANPDYDSNSNAHAEQRSIHGASGFANAIPTWNTAYQPVGQAQEGTEKPLYQRRLTQLSSRSRLSSTSTSTSKLLAPLMVRSWHHGRDKSIHSTSNTVRTFSKGRQSRKTFVHGLVQWIPPVLFSACIALIFLLYDRRTIITRGEKYTFNALVLGFTLLLGFSVQSGFKLYADLMRWRFLASRHWDLKTFERILGSSSQRTVLKLLWSGRKESSWVPSRVQVVSFIYLLFAVGLQVVIACLGLCYSVETSQTDVAWVFNNVSIANMSFIQQRQVTIPFGLSEEQIFVLQSGAANTYGMVSTSFKEVDTNPTPGDHVLSNVINTNPDRTLYWYNFLNRCATGPDCDVSRATSRYISVNATCTEYPIVTGGTVDSPNVTVTLEDGSEFSHYFGNDLVGGTTTYSSDMNVTCGERCASMYVLNVGAVKANETYGIVPQFFFCQNSVGTVHNIPENVDTAAYDLPDLQARILAGAIGYDGSFRDGDPFQMRNYPFRSYWSWDMETQTAQKMTQLVMRYTIGAIAAIDQSGPTLTTLGDEPLRAQAVTVKWDWAAVVLTSVPGIQLLFLFFVIWFTRGVVIRDGSFLGNARLLRPIAQELGDKGCALTGDEIADALDTVRIAYGVRLPMAMTPSGVEHRAGSISVDAPMHLDIIQLGEGTGPAGTRGWAPGMHMPQGRYDGYSDLKQDV